MVAATAEPTAIVTGQYEPSSAITELTEAQGSVMIFAPCTVVVHPALRSYLATLAIPTRDQFHCPTESASEMQGELLQFERGYMIYMVEMERVFVVYDGLYHGINTPWELVYANLLDTLPTSTTVPPTAPEDLVFNPPGVFEKVWETGPNRERLGMAKMPVPEEISVIAQRFHQGWLLLQRSLTGDTPERLHIFSVEARIF